MGDKNTPYHPFYGALSIFNAAVRTPFTVAAAFWRPWFTDDGNKKVHTRQAAEGKVGISMLKTENQFGVIPEAAPMPEEVARPIKRKHKALTPPMKNAGTEPKPPTKHTLKGKFQLEPEDQAHETDRLRKLRHAKEAAAGRKRSPNKAAAEGRVNKR
jgi:hypothetical protein